MRTPVTHLITGLLMLASILLVWTRASQASIEPLEQAIEASPAEVTLPRFDYGQLIIRSCANCPPRVLQASENTIYVLAGRAASAGGEATVTRAEFAEAAGDEAARDGLLCVYFLPDTSEATRIVLTPRPAGERPGRSPR